MVPPRKPDVLEIIMLAPRPHTLLARRRPRIVPLLVAEKDILKLIHPRIGKQQRRVVRRHQRRRVHPAVPLALKKPQKIFSNLASRTIDHRHQVYQRKEPNRTYTSSALKSSTPSPHSHRPASPDPPPIKPPQPSSKTPARAYSD